MTSYICTKHGDIGGDVLSTDAFFDMMKSPPEGSERVGEYKMSVTAYPKREYICARCLKALIDDQFAPLRVKA